VLILSAGVGCGHNAAAEGLREELATAPAAHVTLCNGLGASDGAVRVFLERFTRWQLLRCPAVYAVSYRLGVRWGPGRWLGGLLLHRVSRRHLSSLIAEHRPDVVVCTYPGVTMPLALMRLRGELEIPVCALITDLTSLHFWAHPGADLHLASYAESVQEIAEIAAGGDVQVIRPPLHSAHWTPREPRAARIKLGLDPGMPVVLVSGGGWGLGDLAGAVEVALDLEDAQVVVVCGENRRAQCALGARYASRPRVKVLGYSDEMADLIAAASVLVHCTGGMTCLEAAVHGRPVISYGLGVGHIAHNTSAMVRLGLLAHARDEHGLRVLLEVAISGPPPPPSAVAERPPAANAILELADRCAPTRRSARAACAGSAVGVAVPDQGEALQVAGLAESPEIAGAR